MSADGGDPFEAAFAELVLPALQRDRRRPGRQLCPWVRAWTTTASVPVHEQLTYRHTYANPGTYTVVLAFHATGHCAYGPNHGSATVTVTVTR